MLMANSAAIITDVFPAGSAAWRSASTRSPRIAGQFIGLRARRTAGRMGLAGSLLGRTCRSAWSARSGPTGRCMNSASATPGPHRLVGQRHFRRRA